ncbi:MAG TPA: TonB family protein [Thermoanaerobaculia bacterium]|jgi:protein TonB|nr:TonB family protein [Thermoanaerobaculia bacterium]
MDLAVDQVLAERERMVRSGVAAASLIAAAGLHVAVAALLFVLPRLVPPPPPLEYVAVQLVPAQRLGAVHAAPASERRPPAPRPQQPPEKVKEEPPAPPRSADAPVLPRPQAPPKPPPKPAKPEKPPQPDNRVDPTTQPKFVPPPREVLAKKLGAAAPPQTAEVPGAATGSAAGKAPVGSLTVAPVNQDFAYNYYFAQIQSRIEASWTRSPVGSDAHCVIFFTIHSDGSISDLRVSESSGFDTYDLAASRAVQNAAPFAPLPRAYTLNHTSLEVTWIAR